MSRVEASVEVDAEPATVWAVLTDFDAYPEWNPLVRRVVGRPVEGRRLRVLLTQGAFPPAVIRPEVTRVAAERELAWVSAPPVPGVLEATHRFRLEPLADGRRTRFTQTETFGGAAGRLVPRTVRTRLREGFERMNAALAERAEAVAPATADSDAGGTDASGDRNR